jgi:hypothetical protein
VPSHGTNRGSNPLRDAIEINGFGSWPSGWSNFGPWASRQRCCDLPDEKYPRTLRHLSHLRTQLSRLRLCFPRRTRPRHNRCHPELTGFWHFAGSGPVGPNISAQTPERGEAPHAGRGCPIDPRRILPLRHYRLPSHGPTLSIPLTMGPRRPRRRSKHELSPIVSVWTRRKLAPLTGRICPRADRGTSLSQAFAVACANLFNPLFPMSYADGRTRS